MQINSRIFEAEVKNNQGSVRLNKNDGGSRNYRVTLGAPLFPHVNTILTIVNITMLFIAYSYTVFESGTSIYWFQAFYHGRCSLSWVIDTDLLVSIATPGVPALYEKEIPGVSPEKVPKFHEKYFPFNEVAGKSISGSSTANCYCLESCVIFTKATITSQSMNTTWTLGTRRTYPKLAKTFPFWVTLTSSLNFPWICVCFSLSFPWLEQWNPIFQVFPDFQSGWEPWTPPWETGKEGPRGPHWLIDTPTLSR